MNATQTLILDKLAASNSYHTVKEIQEMTGKGETTIRENLKVLLANGDVSKDGKLYTNTPIVPEAPAMDADVETGREFDNDHAAEMAAAAEDEATRTAEDGVEIAIIDGMRVEGPAPEAPAKKKYRRHEIPTTRTVRINQITKSEVKVASAAEMDVEEPEGKWATLCLTHDAIVWNDLVLDAHFASTYPEFCPTCAPLLVGKVGRRRKDAKKA